MESGLPCFPPGSSCPVVLRYQLALLGFKIRGFHTLCQVFPDLSSILTLAYRQPSTPMCRSTLVWALPRSLAATGRISFDFFSSGYLDVSVHRVPPLTLCIYVNVPCGGFPHSDICGSTSMCNSPQLFAAYHVLLRLLMPRHSPYALFSLIFHQN